MKGLIEFKLRQGSSVHGERVVMPIASILCLFPDHRQIMTVQNGWTLDVSRDDWDRIEREVREAHGEIVEDSETADEKIDRAAKAIYEKYGPNLSAFFRDVEEERKRRGRR